MRDPPTSTSVPASEAGSSTTTSTLGIVRCRHDRDAADIQRGEHLVNIMMIETVTTPIFDELRASLRSVPSSWKMIANETTDIPKPTIYLSII